MTDQEQHARFRLDEVIHAPVRFSIVAALAHVEEADFAAVRDAVQVSDSVLSKQVTLLERAGYVEVKKGYVGSVQRAPPGPARDRRPVTSAPTTVSRGQRRRRR